MTLIDLYLSKKMEKRENSIETSIEFYSRLLNSVENQTNKVGKLFYCFILYLFFISALNIQIFRDIFARFHLKLLSDQKLCDYY